MRGPRNWVRLELDPAIFRLLEQYTAIINHKLRAKGIKHVSQSRIVGAILSYFLLPQKDRVFDEYEKILLWATRDIIRETLRDGELEAIGLSEVPYIRRTSADRTRVPGTKYIRKRNRSVRGATTEGATTPVSGSPGGTEKV